MKSVIFATLIFLNGFVHAYDPSDSSSQGQNILAHETPRQLQGVGLTDKRGEKIDLSLQFTDDDGQKKSLATLFADDRPVLLTMVYYTCPNLCSLTLNGLNDGFKKLHMTAGKDFRVVAVSMNHKETSDVAAKKKSNYLKEYGRPDAKDWHFMVGDEASVKALADQIGFGFKWDEASQQYAHAAAAYLMTPQGTISQFLAGIEFPERDLRLGLTEAGQGEIGTIIDRLVLMCFHFDPASNKYVIYAWNLMRISAIFMVLVLFIFLIPRWRREKRMAT